MPDKKPLDKFPSPSNGNRSPEPQKSALISTLMPAWRKLKESYE